MNQLRQKSSHKDYVKNFMSITSVSEKQATRILQQYNWNLDHALDAFFLYQSASVRTGGSNISNNHSYMPSNGIDLKKIDLLFNRYKDSAKPDQICASGMEKFLVSDLQLDPNSIIVLALAWKFKARTQCEFSKKEFVDGMVSLESDTIDKLKSKIPHLTECVKDPQTFKQIYLFTFNFAKLESGRHLEIELAIPYWHLLLNNRFRYLDLWFEFLKEKQVKCITKDVWDMFFEFISTTDEKMLNYDMEGAYPVLVDEFVVYARSKIQNLTPAAFLQSPNTDTFNQL